MNVFHINKSSQLPDLKYNLLILMYFFSCIVNMHVCRNQNLFPSVNHPAAIHLSVYISSYLLSIIYPHTYLSSVYPHLCLSITYLPTYLSICLSICPSVLPSFMSTIHNTKPFEKQELQLRKCPELTGLWVNLFF